MREANFAFPAQNRACVCITSQLYDRRALDTTSSLPLFNSLTHLTYLTSTSPRIREIMTMDGGLERLVRILHEFCICPPPPENPAILYGLSPPTARSPKLVPTLNPQSFDKHAAYRFSLAFQCIVNIGVRGSEPIRSRVVQAGTLDVVGCILEAWLANKGFAVCPSSSATGMPRETREQRLARRLAMAEQLRQREEAAELAIALQRQIQTADADLSMDDLASNANQSHPSVPTDTDTSTDTSTAATPIRSNTPTGAVFVPSRDRSGTVIGQPIWDHPPRNQRRQLTPDSLSRPDTETEDDADGDVDMDRARDVDDTSPSPRPRHQSLRRTVVGIISDAPPQATIDADAHIIINDVQGVVGADGGVGLGAAGGVEDGIVSLEANDDFAMGAPPGAPGAIGLDDGADDREVGRRGRAAPDVTPRAAPVNLPLIATAPVGGRTGAAVTVQPPAGHGRATHRTRGGGDNTAMTVPSRATLSSTHHHNHRDSDSGPYRDEDVLLSLQLLAYLSKYPHVRQAFYKPRATFHPASASLPGARSEHHMQQGVAGPSRTIGKLPAVKEQQGIFRAFAAGRGKEKEKENAVLQATSSTPSSAPAVTSGSTVRHTNVFSLVERFTFRPSSSESNMPNPPPQLPPEIQYWAGVIMRNACRKDESRGGIRQCANMLCGKWETSPREFAKCRRCRKAKYCGKECQSTAWSEGHRFWCSAKEGDGDGDENQSNTGAAAGDEGGEGIDLNDAMNTHTVTTGRTDRERHAHTLVQGELPAREGFSADARGGDPLPNSRGLNRLSVAAALTTGRHRTPGQDPAAPLPPHDALGHRATARQATYIRHLQLYGTHPPTTSNHPTETNFDVNPPRVRQANAVTADQDSRSRGETLTGTRFGVSIETREERHPHTVAVRPSVALFLPPTVGDNVEVAEAGGMEDNLDMVD